MPSFGPLEYSQRGMEKSAVEVGGAMRHDLLRHGRNGGLSGPCEHVGRGSTSISGVMSFALQVVLARVAVSSVAAGTRSRTPLA